VDRTRTVLLFGNRTTPAADSNVTEQASSRRALPFYASIRIQLKQRELLRQIFGIAGARIEVTTIKNKVALPLRATLDLMFGRGFARES
jgi:recombination protein RecA